MRPTGSQVREGYVPSSAQEKGEEVWDFNGKEDDSEEDEKEKMFGKRMFAGPLGTTGT